MKARITLSAILSLALMGLLATEASAQRLTGGFLGISDNGVSIGASFGHRGGGFGLALGGGRSHLHVGAGRHIHGVGCHRTFHPGRYTIVRKRVLGAGYYRTVRVAPRYKWVRRGGRRVRVAIGRSCSRRVYVPGTYSWVNQRVWSPGYYGVGCGISL